MRGIIEQALKGLSEERPVFNIEADFQFAFAWMLKKKLGDDIDIRLEYGMPPVKEEGKKAKREYIDMVLFDRKGRRYYPIELKYKTVLPSKYKYICAKGERFYLKNQGAQDEGCYMTIKDLSRIENLKETKLANCEFGTGYVIMITNDKSYLCTHKGTLKNYWLYDHTIYAGELKYELGGRKPEETFLKKFEPNGQITLKADYELVWHDFSESDEGIKFYRLLIEV